MPVTPDDAARHAKSVADIYAEATHAILRIVAQRLARGIDQPGWAEHKAAELLQLRREAQRAVDRIAGATEREAQAILRAAYGDGADQGDRDLRDLTRDLVAKGRRAPRLQVAATNIDTVDALARELVGQLHATIPNAVRWAQDVYRQVIAQTIGVAAAGVETRRAAAARALARFASVGVDGFTDRRGRSWQLETYAEMAARTALIRASNAGTANRLLRSGRDLVRVSDHLEECPLCRPFEGKVFSLTGTSTEHPPLDKAIAGGLFHPNCRHSIAAYVPGLSRPVRPSTDDDGYELRQEQRKLERRVRHAKRRLAAVDGLGTAVQVRRERDKVRAAQARLRAFVAEHDRKRLPYREQIGRAR